MGYALLNGNQIPRYAANADGQPIGLAGPDGLIFQDQYAVRNSGHSSRILTKGFLGRFTTLTTVIATIASDHTTHIQTVLEAGFDSMQLLIPNAVTAAVTGVTARIGVASVLGAADTGDTVAPATGLWTPAVTFNGASSVTLPAGISGDIPSWTASDWINTPSLARTDGGTLPVLLLRLFVPLANANRTAYNYAALNGWESEAQVAGRVWRPRSQAVDGVTTLGNFTLAGSVDDYQCHPVIIRYVSRVSGMTMMVLGNSINEGGGETNRYGWQFRAAHAASTPEFPIEVCTLAVGGSSSVTSKNRAIGAIPLIKPEIVVVPGFDINDTNVAPMTDTQIRTMRGNTGIVLAVCRDNGAIPVIATGIPRNPPPASQGLDYNSSDSLRRNLNNDWRDDPDILKTDFDSVMAGVTDVDGQVSMIVGKTDDGLHPNGAGHITMGAEMADGVLASFISRNKRQVATA